MILTETGPKSLSRVGRVVVAVIAIVVVPLLPVRGQAQQAEPAGQESARANATSVASSQPTGADEATRRAVEALLDRAVQDPNDQVRNAAMGAIARFGPRAIPALLEGVRDERTAEAARNVLARFGLESVDPLLAALNAPEPQVRREALNAMSQVLANAFTSQFAAVGAAGYRGAFGGGYGGGFGAPGGEMVMEGAAAFPPPGAVIAMSEPVERMIGPVTKAARDADAGVRRAALQLMSHLALIASRANAIDKLMPTIVAAMKDPDPEVRGDAVWTLTQVGPPAASATEALTAALKDDNQRVRFGALQTLRGIGAPARDATPAVIATLKDPDPNIRTAAAEALGALQASPPPQAPGAVDPTSLPPGTAPPALPPKSRP
jgi:HEAT repeat protein